MSAEAPASSPPETEQPNGLHEATTRLVGALEVADVTQNNEYVPAGIITTGVDTNVHRYGTGSRSLQSQEVVLRQPAGDYSIGQGIEKDESGKVTDMRYQVHATRPTGDKYGRMTTELTGKRASRAGEILNNRAARQVEAESIERAKRYVAAVEAKTGQKLGSSNS